MSDLLEAACSLLGFAARLSVDSSKAQHVVAAGMAVQGLGLCCIVLRCAHPVFLGCYFPTAFNLPAFPLQLNDDAARDSYASRLDDASDAAAATAHAALLERVTGSASPVSSKPLARALRASVGAAVAVFQLEREATRWCADLAAAEPGTSPSASQPVPDERLVAVYRTAVATAYSLRGTVASEKVRSRVSSAAPRRSTKAIVMPVLRRAKFLRRCTVVTSFSPCGVVVKTAAPPSPPQPQRLHATLHSVQQGTVVPSPIAVGGVSHPGNDQAPPSTRAAFMEFLLNGPPVADVVDAQALHECGVMGTAAALHLARKALLAVATGTPPSQSTLMVAQHLLWHVHHVFSVSAPSPGPAAMTATPHATAPRASGAPAGVAAGGAVLQGAPNVHVLCVGVHAGLAAILLEASASLVSVATEVLHGPSTTSRGATRAAALHLLPWLGMVPTPAPLRQVATRLLEGGAPLAAYQVARSISPLVGGGSSSSAAGVRRKAVLASVIAMLLSPAACEASGGDSKRVDALVPVVQAIAEDLTRIADMLQRHPSDPDIQAAVYVSFVCQTMQPHAIVLVTPSSLCMCLVGVRHRNELLLMLVHVLGVSTTIGDPATLSPSLSTTPALTTLVRQTTWLRSLALVMLFGTPSPQGLAARLLAASLLAGVSSMDDALESLPPADSLRSLACLPPGSDEAFAPQAVMRWLWAVPTLASAVHLASTTLPGSAWRREVLLLPIPIRRLHAGAFGCVTALRFLVGVDGAKPACRGASSPSLPQSWQCKVLHQHALPAIVTMRAALESCVDAAKRDAPIVSADATRAASATPPPAQTAVGDRGAGVGAPSAPSVPLHNSAPRPSSIPAPGRDAGSLLAVVARGVAALQLLGRFSIAPAVGHVVRACDPFRAAPLRGFVNGVGHAGGGGGGGGHAPGAAAPSGAALLRLVLHGSTRKNAAVPPSAVTVIPIAPPAVVALASACGEGDKVGHSPASATRASQPASTPPKCRCLVLDCLALVGAAEELKAAVKRRLTRTAGAGAGIGVAVTHMPLEAQVLPGVEQACGVVGVAVLQLLEEMCFHPTSAVALLASLSSAPAELLESTIKLGAVPRSGMLEHAMSQVNSDSQSAVLVGLIDMYVVEGCVCVVVGLLLSRVSGRMLSRGMFS